MTNATTQDDSLAGKVAVITGSARGIGLAIATELAAAGTRVALLDRQAEAVAAVPRVLAEPRPQVLLSSFAADGLELTVAYWIGDPHNGDGNVRSAVNLALLRTLNERDGVTIVTATHDPIVLGYARRHVRLVDGRIVEDVRDAAK